MNRVENSCSCDHFCFCVLGVCIDVFASSCGSCVCWFVCVRCFGLRSITLIRVVWLVFDFVLLSVVLYCFVWIGVGVAWAVCSVRGGVGLFEWYCIGLLGQILVTDN